jgi:nucleoside-diphosphate-sugar epimerase
MDSKLKVLIVGSTGYVGSLLAKRLKNEPQIELSTLDRTKNADAFNFTLNTSQQTVIGDLRKQETFSKISEAKLVFLIAADTRRGQSVEDASNLVLANAWLPSLVGSYLDKSAAHIVHLGTYSYRQGETNDIGQTLYSTTKAAGELVLRYLSDSSTISLTALHTYDIYGPNQPQKRLINYVVESIRNKQPMNLSEGEQEIRPVVVRDVIEVLAGFVEYKRPEKFFEAFDLYGPETLKVKDLPFYVAKSLGIELDSSFVNLGLPYRPREIMKFDPCHPLPEHYQNWTTLEQALAEG